MLVATELTLKDRSGAWGRKHDVPQMLDDLGDPGLTALGMQLRTGLSSVPCTDLSGNQAMVRPQAFPDLRYARHENDYAGGTTNANLQNLVQTVDDIIVQLQARGIAI
jgi:hypothetical protein